MAPHEPYLYKSVDIRKDQNALLTTLISKHILICDDMLSPESLTSPGRNLPLVPAVVGPLVLRAPMGFPSVYQDEWRNHLHRVKALVGTITITMKRSRDCEREALKFLPWTQSAYWLLLKYLEANEHENFKFNMNLMKVHDCHVIVTQLLPIAIRGVLLEKVCDPIIKLCSFVNAISHKVLDLDTLEKLQKDVVRTLTRLEMHLPPTYFFDMCIHLLMHLVDQLRALGLMFLHQMFPSDRLMSILRKYVWNRHKPEWCIVEGWSTAVEFCTYYLGPNRITVPVSRHEGRLNGKGSGGRLAKGQYVLLTLMPSGKRITSSSNSGRCTFSLYWDA
jgi:hypothetical protein